MALKESLTQEEALEAASKAEAEEIDTEDKINMELEKFVDNSNVSFFAFTATPKATTLRLFGTQGEDGKYWIVNPFLYKFYSVILDKRYSTGVI